MDPAERGRQTAEGFLASAVYIFKKEVARNNSAQVFLSALFK
jgi:hypothetical protein